MKRLGPLIILFLVFLSAYPVAGQDIRVISVGYRELHLAKDDISDLMSIASLNTQSAHALLQDNDTVFWQEIGGFDASFASNSSLRSFAIVQINQSGFFESIIMLDANTEELDDIRPINQTISQNFSIAVTAATDFFANDGHYWGICEKLVIVPGSNYDLGDEPIWLFRFHLVGESERWELRIGLNGTILNYQFEDVPCQSCDDYTIMVIAVLSSILLVIALIALRPNVRQS